MRAETEGNDARVGLSCRLQGRRDRVEPPHRVATLAAPMTGR